MLGAKVEERAPLQIVQPFQSPARSFSPISPSSSPYSPSLASAPRLSTIFFLFMSSSIGFKFGSFDYFCDQVTLTVCPLVGGVEPQCYSRSLEVGGTLLFQPGAYVIYLVALIMTVIMIFHIKVKFTAVGRKEILIFFYMYIALVIVEFLLVSGIIPVTSVVYPYFTAAHIGLITALFWCLVLNGFVGYQWTEDGTAQSLWTIRLSSLLLFGIAFFISIATFKGLIGFSSSNPIALFVVYLIFNAVCLAVYVVSQIILVLTTLDDRWALADVLVGFTFFTMGLIFQFVLSPTVCNGTQHYIDGFFFGALFTLLGVMMVYKFWDDITKEDLEFSVGGKTNVWEIKDPLLNDEQMALMANEHQRLQGHYDR
ncbi:Chitin synthase, class 7 [Gonapodya sp. JEL0774]|nr:Chitin synthase, class 7 [Gonapodya sp. JEL0774]